MKKIVVGILAHVDAGKTTLSEAMLYCSGILQKMGRVDHRDAYLDTEKLEQERGITIFSKQAVIPLTEFTMILMDTPGHVDFSSEMERTIQVLDYAILVISGTDGIQGHTKTVWKLLKNYHTPVLFFVNKMDLPGAEKADVLQKLQAELSPGCIDFSQDENQDKFWEEIAVQNETLLENYFSEGILSEKEIAEAVGRREIFPCYFGSALKLDGVQKFLDGFQRYAVCPAYPENFGARVYKIARDSQGARLTYLKITGGRLKVKDMLRGYDRNEENLWQEKVEQIRIYSGARFTAKEHVEAGTVCAVTGLSKTWAGQGLGQEEAAGELMLQPVMSCEVQLPEGLDAHHVLVQLEQLEEEEPQLHIIWNERRQKIQLQMMGEIQLDILKRIILERFHIEVDFEPGKILYKETISNTVEGVGHFEPLRHYAEVRLLLEPMKRGEGIHYSVQCSEDVLDKNWQRLILSHLMEREHAGILSGSPVTDIKITLTAGKAHQKHTEGGDFRQAAYRAVRQGLMQAENILLEPWYAFQIEVPSGMAGRAMADIQRMGGESGPPQPLDMETILTGRAPVSSMRGYAAELSGYTKGQGRIFCTLDGYEPCCNTEKILQEIQYEPERDIDNTPDSVFCSHGRSFIVRWHDVPAYAHTESLLHPPAGQETEGASGRGGKTRHPALDAQAEDEQLMQIFERTYGPVKQREPLKPAEKEEAPQYQTKPSGPEYLLVDGYNIIFAWDELKELGHTNLEAARQALMDILCNYQGFRKCVVIIVFDAYKVRQNAGEVLKYNNIYIVYTKEAETADMYIEKATYQLQKQRQVRVATSDGMEQIIILGHGALRISARAFHEEVKAANTEIKKIISSLNQKDARFLRKELFMQLQEEPRDDKK